MAARKTSKKAQKANEVVEKVEEVKEVKEVKVAEPEKVPESHMDGKVISTESASPVLSLKPEELWKMRYFEAESRVAQKDAAIAKIIKNMILSRVDPKGLIAAENKKAEAAMAAAEKAKAEYRKTMIEVSVRLGVNLAGCAIDPDTGVVIPQ